MGLRVVPVLHCVGLHCVLCCHGSEMLLTAGQASREPLPGCLEWHHPGGGQRRGASPAGSRLSSRKIEKGYKFY